VIDAVTSIVAEMTGYPADLLDPDLDLEADLGVDTVKQAEVFAAVREHYELERDDNLQLRDFPTLRHVASWVRDRTGTAAPVAQVAEPVAGVAAASAPAGDDVMDAVTSIVAEMTGYPARICWIRIWIWRRIWVSTR
jgi:acyl carrier protein